MAYIEKRPAGYLVRWRDGGKAQSAWYKRKADALDFKAELEASKRRGSYVPRHKRSVPVQDYALRVLEVQELNLRTLANYYSTLRNHVDGTSLGLMGIGEVGGEDAREFFARLKEDGATPSVRFAIRRLLSKVFRSAMADGLLLSNPIAAVPTPQVAPHQTEPLTPQEVERVADAIDPRYRALVLLLAYTGLRPGEAAGLSLDNVDLERGLVHVERNLKTKKSRRAVAMPQSVSDEVRRHLEAYPSTSGRVFATATGRPVARETLGRAWHRACDKAGVPQRRPYDLRHTQASWLMTEDIGAAIPVAQARMGHSTSRMLLDVYAHRMKNADDVVAERLDALRALGKEAQGQFDQEHPGSDAAADSG